MRIRMRGSDFNSWVVVAILRKHSQTYLSVLFSITVIVCLVDVVPY